MDKIDGPYYFFKVIQKLRDLIPRWMPVVGLEGGKINVVPVDFVASAMDHIAHQPGLDGQAFHLTDPKPKSAGQLVNTFARAAHAPEATMRIDRQMMNVMPKRARSMIAQLPPVRRITDQLLGDFGIPREVLTYIDYPSDYDCRDAQRALDGTGIQVPALEAYADRLWDYWERNLDPDLFKDRSLRGAIEGKVVVITGASSGIGQALAMKVGEAGGVVALVARSEDKLTGDQGRDRGGGRYGHRASRRSLRPRGRGSPGRGGPARARPRGRPGQQRRSLHPAVDRELLRPLPRLPAHDAAQLLRRAKADHGVPADDA